MQQDTFEPGPLADVGCDVADGRWTLVFVKDLQHPPEKVWAALTEPDQLLAWAPYTADRNLSSVGEANLTMIDGETPEKHPVTVTRADKPTLLEHTWGADLLRWELAAMPAGTRLTLRHAVDSEDMVSQIAAGWHLCLLVAERLLDGAPIPPIRGYDAMSFGWEDLRRAYAERLGPPGGGR